MSVTTNLIKAAVVQAEPVWFDLAGTVTKTCDLIKDAASKGAHIIAFPELWLPGYPTWIWARPMDFEMVVKYTKNSLNIDSSEMQDIKCCAAESNIIVCLGFSERSGDSLYIAQCIIDSDGEVLMTRRKLKPFHIERTIFGDGHGPSLDNVALTSVGRVGQLSCGEHFNPLINFNTYSQGEQIHCAAWPCVPVHSGGPEPYSMSDEGPSIDMMGTKQAPVFNVPGGGNARIFAPDGRQLTSELPATEEGMVVADLDLDQTLSLQPPDYSLGKEHSTEHLNRRTEHLSRLEPLSYVNTTRLQVAYYEDGSPDSQVVLLLHGWPYDIHSYTEVAPALVKQGYRVIVPYLRGNGPTTFRHTDTFRSGQQAALGLDITELLDALSIKKAIFAGYDWGGRGACVAAALWPERCAGLVSVNGYLIQDLSKAWVPLDAKIEAGFWYFYYFLTPRGQAALAEHPKDIARVVWNKNSPEWNYTEADLDRAAETFANPDYVSVVTHVYRHRLLYAPGDPDYSDIEKALLKQPVISVPTVTLDGLADGNFPPTNGSSSAKYFSGPRVHHQVPGAGHNLPQEKPEAFVNAVLEVTSLK
ncbi:hypothetical protein LZL87_009618 [Fusarium oxysporum]|nr:hypothetical protein LZL87_009618 [Fusarium oxysporum]